MPTRFFGSLTSERSGATATAAGVGGGGGGAAGGGGAPPQARPESATAKQDAAYADLILPPIRSSIVCPVYTASRAACHAADHAERAIFMRDKRRPAKCCTPTATKSGVRTRKRSTLPRFFPKKYGRMRARKASSKPTGERARRRVK